MLSRAKNRALDLSAATTCRTLAVWGQDELPVTGPARYSIVINQTCSRRAEMIKLRSSLDKLPNDFQEGPHGLRVSLSENSGLHNKVHITSNPLRAAT